LKTKEIILAVLTAGLGVVVFWFWFDAVPLVIGGQFRDYIDFIGPVAGLLIVAVLVLYSAIFIGDKRIVYPALLIGFISPYLFLEASGTVLAAVAVSAFLVAFATHRIRQEVNLTQGFSLTKFAKAGLSIFFTAAALLVAIFYLAHIDKEQAVANLLPRAAFDIVIPLLEKQYGTEIPNKEETAELLYRAAVEQFKQLLGPYQDFMPLASAVIFFFAFKTFTIPIYYLTLVFAFFLLKLMLWSKIVKREITQVEVERLHF
jgi:hypothetical protein